MKILIISLAGIGDTLFATPLIEQLKIKMPSCKIDVLVTWKGSAEILKNNPHINKIFEYNMMKEGFLKSLLFCLNLRANKYDLSINTCVQQRVAYRMVSFLIHSKKRIGHTYDNYNVLDNLLLTKSKSIDYGNHAIENNISLLNLIGINNVSKLDPKLYLLKNNVKIASDFLKQHNLEGKKILGISTGTGKTKNLALRRWPLSYYEDLIRKVILNDRNMRILLFAGPEELKENLELINKIKNEKVILVNQKSLLDVAAILKNCDIFLSVDNVMEHIAAALNVRKQVLINTPSVNKTVLPYNNNFILVGSNPPKEIIYRYNGKGIPGKRWQIEKYMRNISPDDVFNAIKESI